MNNLILFLIIFLIILFLFFIMNMILKRNVENYGIFCGRYNFEPTKKAMKKCKKDFNCTWKSYTDTSSGLINSWCTNTPSSTLKLEPNISDLRNIIEEESGETPITSYGFSLSNYNGSQLKNISTGLYDATLLNGPTVGNSGPTSSIYAINFDATLEQYVALDPSTTSGNGLSYACWVKADPSNGTWARIFDFGNGAANDNIIMFINDGSLGLSVYDGPNTAFQPYGTVANIDDNNWYFIVWTLSTSNAWNVYVNGTLEITYEDAPYPNQVSRSLQYLGKSNWTYDPYFTGSIANFSIYDSVLSSNEVRKLYKQ